MDKAGMVCTDCDNSIPWDWVLVAALEPEWDVESVLELVVESRNSTDPDNMVLGIAADTVVAVDYSAGNTSSFVVAHSSSLEILLCHHFSAVLERHHCQSR